MKQRHVLWRGRCDLMGGIGGAHQCPKVLDVGNLSDLAGIADQQDVDEARQSPAQLGDLAAVQGGGGHEHARVPQAQSLLDRLRPERREQWTEHGTVLERPERRDAQLGDPAGEHEHPLAGLDPERR